MFNAEQRKPSKVAVDPNVAVTPKGEILHHGPMAVKQNYDSYTEEEHAVWRDLFRQQRENLKDIAFQTWLEAGDLIGLTDDRIPRLSDLSAKLRPLTGWTPVPVEGFLDEKSYFEYLSKRQFPTVPSIRPREKFEFIAEPDIFHDAFGHLPMHSHPAFADFLQLFGQTACQASTKEQMTEMQRLYWFTVEYCLIRVKGELKVCGSGHMSGIKESRYSLTDKVEKREFDLENVCRQQFNPHVLQDVMFVIDSYDQVYEAMIEKAKQYGAWQN